MLVCLATLPAILFAFYIANNERVAALARMEEDTHHIVSLISREHFYQMTGAKRLLRWLAGQLADSTKKDKDPALLPALLSGYPQLANIAILTPAGDVISSAHPLPAPLNMHDYDAVRRASSSQEIETGVYVIGPIVKRPILHLAYAVRNSKNSVQRIVFVAIDLQWLSRLTDEIELPTEHLLIVTDREGSVLASSAKPEDTVVALGTQIPELAEKKRQGKNSLRAVIGGKVQTFALAPMEGLPGVMIASGLPHDLIFRKANGVFYRMIGLLFLLTLCTIISVMLFEEVVLIRYLRTLSRGLRRFGQGDFSARTAVPLGTGELQEMARTFNAMAESLSVRHKELREAHNRLDMLARHLQTARESEAQRIARDLHDEAGQVLTSLKIDLTRLKKKCGQCQPKGMSGHPIQTDIVSMSDKIDNIIGFIRRISSEIRPPVLDNMGLSAAIEKLAREVQDNTNLAVEVESVRLAQPVDWLVATALYRIVQEALTNVTRHAEASLVTIELRMEGEETILLSIRDNGKGFDTNSMGRESLGIIGMRERAHLIGGVFLIERAPDKGTIITVRASRTGNKGTTS
jgi:signal transduction histidine kinase